MICKIGFTNWNAKIALLRGSMVITCCIKLFQMGGDRHNGILMCLLLLVVESKSIRTDFFVTRMCRNRIFDKISQNHCLDRPSVKKVRGIWNGERKWKIGKKILFWLEKSFYSFWIVFETCIGNFHLKAHLHSLIIHFVDWISRSVNRGMWMYLGAPDTFFAGDLFWSCIMLFKKFSVLWKSIST